MPSNKIVSTFIICFAFVLSIWIFSRENTDKNTVAQINKNTETVSSIQTKEVTNDDWKKILTRVDEKNPFEDLTILGGDEDDTTLTDQLSRDFMSQYLLAVKAGEEINKETADVIAQKTLSLPEYNSKSVVYIRQNLKVTPKGDSETMRVYREKINQSLQSVYYGLKDDPMNVVITAIGTENENDIKKLDPIISVNKATIKYLLEMDVPEKAVLVHLELINISSAILSDLENMRAGLEDPVKMFNGIGNYAQNSDTFARMLTKMNEFLLKNS